MHVQNEISLFYMIVGFKFEYNIWYPKITKDIMEYPSFCDAWLDSPDAPQHSLPLICTMMKTWMPDLTRKRWSKPSTNYCSCWRSKRRRATRTWPLYFHSCPSCTRVTSLHVCGRGYGGWFSLSTGRRSGQYVHSVVVVPVLTRSGPQGY